MYFIYFYILIKKVIVGMKLIKPTTTFLEGNAYGKKKNSYLAFAFTSGTENNAV